MTENVYYIESSITLTETLKTIKKNFSHCRVHAEPIEMNYMQVEIISKTEDVKSIEKLLAPLM